MTTDNFNLNAHTYDSDAESDDGYTEVNPLKDESYLIDILINQKRIDKQNEAVNWSQYFYSVFDNIYNLLSSLLQINK